MAIRFKMRKTPFKSNGNYHARAITGNRLDLEDLVREMDLAGSSLTATDIRGVLLLLKETIMRILLRGDMVCIDELVKFVPKVKSVINRTAAGLEETKPAATVRCSVMPEFKAAIGKRAELQKVDATEVIPRLANVYSGLEKKTWLRPGITNNLSGSKLKPGNMQLAGLRVSCAGYGDSDAETVTFGVEQLALDYHTNSLLVFAFKSTTTFPPWLTEDLPVEVSLLYSHNGRTLETSRAACSWTTRE